MQIIKKLKVVVLATLAFAGLSVQAASEPRISVQLWSVKDDLAADFQGTLKKLADMGFEGVEFAGNYGSFAEDPEGLKNFLAGIGLEASGAHVGFDKFNDENFADTVEFFSKLGARYQIVPYDQRSFDPAAIDAMNAELAVVAKELEKHGLQTGYHNHAPEFGDFKDSTYWDYIASNTPKNVVLQLDVGWAAVAGKDGAAYIRKYPNRTKTTHFKAGLPEGTKDKVSIIGQDIVDWKSVIKAAREVGGTEWFVVEQEVYPNNLTPLQAVEASMQGLQKILADMK